MSQQLCGTTEICGYDFLFCYDADTENICCGQAFL